MKNKYILIIAIFILLSLFVRIRNPIKGRVINSATGQPIENVYIERIINLEAASIAGSSTQAHLKSISYTDKEGAFIIPRKIFFVFPITRYVDGEWLNLNTSSPDLHDYSSESQYQKSINSKFYIITNYEIPNLRWNKNFAIELAPRIENLSECNQNQLCIAENSFDFAINNLDENLCFNIQENEEFYHRYKIFKCFQIIAYLKNDSSICKRILEIETGEYFDNLQQEMDYCEGIPTDRPENRNGYFCDQTSILKERIDLCHHVFERNH